MDPPQPGEKGIGEDLHQRVAMDRVIRDFRGRNGLARDHSAAIHGCRPRRSCCRAEGLSHNGADEHSPKICPGARDEPRAGGRTTVMFINTKGAKVARRSQDHTFDVLLEQNDVEVDQKAEPPRQSKIRRQLRLMDRRQCVNRFHLQ